MIQYLIAGLVGGAVALAQKPKKKGVRKMAHGGDLDLLPEYRREQLLTYITDRSIDEMNLDGQLGALYEYGYHDMERIFAGNDKALIKAYEDKTTFSLPTMEYIASEFAKGGRVSTYEYEAGRNPKQPFDVIGRKDGMVMYHTTRESIKDSTEKAEELLENGYDEGLIGQP